MADVMHHKLHCIIYTGSWFIVDASYIHTTHIILDLYVMCHVSYTIHTLSLSLYTYIYIYTHDFIQTYLHIL